MPRIRLASTAAVTATAALALLPASPGAQGGLPACDPSVTAQPAFGSSGFPEADGGRSDARLFATHPVTVGFALPFADDKGRQMSDLSVDAPPAGLARVTSQDVMTGAGLDDSDRLAEFTTFVGEAPGTYTLGVRWRQYDSNGNNGCAAAASTQVTLAPPIARPRLSKFIATRGSAGDENTVTLKLPRTGGDMRPLEVRYRAVPVQRFPGAGAKGRTFAVAMRASDPGFRSNREATVKVGGLEARFEPDNGDGDLRGYAVVFHIRSAGGRNYGFDLDVRQGGRTITRLRVAGRCSRVGGSINCTRKKVVLTP